MYVLAYLLEPEIKASRQKPAGVKDFFSLSPANATRIAEDLRAQRSPHSVIHPGKRVAISLSLLHVPVPPSDTLTQAGCRRISLQLGYGGGLFSEHYVGEDSHCHHTQGQPRVLRVLQPIPTRTVMGFVESVRS